VIAIDFGTSNSTLGLATPQGSRLIPVEQDHLVIPSAIFFNLEEDCIQFGRAAITAYTRHYEGRLLRALKSVLGSSLVEEATQIGLEKISLREVIRKFVAHLKGIAERHAGRDISRVIFGRPVWFVDDDPKLDALAQSQLESIARSCGFAEVHFQYEPIAAALDYESGVAREELALIADIGGGTSDFSIVRVSPERHHAPDRRQDILANTGVHVGGTDFDKWLSLGQVMPQLGYKTHYRDKRDRELPSSAYFDLATWHRIAFLNGKQTSSLLREMHQYAARPELVHRLMRVVREQTGHQLASDVERAKIALSSDDSAVIELPYVDDDLTLPIDGQVFEKSVAGLTEKISNSIRECVRNSGVSPGQIDTLFLTGGTSSLSFVRDACARAVPAARVIEGDKFGSVGIGLTIQAGVLMQETSG
jgi:hypothetical chaperone protein